MQSFTYEVPGDYFGEVALLTQQKIRVASVRAITDVQVAMLDKNSFKRLLSPLLEIMKNNLSAYTSSSRIIVADPCSFELDEHHEAARAQDEEPDNASAAIDTSLNDGGKVRQSLQQLVAIKSVEDQFRIKKKLD